MIPKDRAKLLRLLRIKNKLYAGRSRCARFRGLK